MKSIATLFLFLFSQVIVFAQPCLPDGITFTTQAQIDSFQINYPNCTEIEGNVTISGSDITNLIGLNVLTSFGNRLSVYGNEALVNLSGIEGTTVIGGGVYLHYNPALTSLSGLDNVTSIGGKLTIEENNALTSLSALGNLISVGGLNIGFNGALTSLSGLDNLTSLVGHLQIYYNTSLTSLMILDNLIADSIINLSIHHNSSLSACEAQSICSYLTNPGGRIIIRKNSTGCNNPPEIASACGFVMDCLPYGNYYFHNQTDVDSFQVYYPGCTDLEGDFKIWGNDIANLDGLDAVTSIGGDLIIGDYYVHNMSLTSLMGLVNVSSIGGKLSIGYSDVLTSLSGLDYIDAGSIENLEIGSNNLLSTCEVSSICEYLSSPNGYANIVSNAPGCNSKEEVMDSCGLVGMENQFWINHISVSPNPFTASTILSYNLDKPSTVTIQIFNPQGQLIEKIEQEQSKGEQQVQWNAEGLPAGMYYFTISDNSGKTRSCKLLKY